MPFYGLNLPDYKDIIASMLVFEAKPGHVIGGDYEVIELLGRGGMGTVYKVKRLSMTGIYALKVLHTSDEPIQADLAWRRFQQEAQVIARLQHANIISIFDMALHENQVPFYVMDYLVGKSLFTKLNEVETLPRQPALNIFVEVARGLAFAHSKGVVHRDMKPENIFLLDTVDSFGASIKLLDFGIVKLTTDQLRPSQSLTSFGEVFGSPLYMAPEQILGEAVDARADIYSLGCALFETLTGAPPYVGANPVETMKMHQLKPVPTLREATGGQDFGADLEQVMAALLAKKPSDRYQHMDHVLRDLEKLAGIVAPQSLSGVQKDLPGQSTAQAAVSGASPLSAPRQEYDLKPEYTGSNAVQKGGLTLSLKLGIATLAVLLVAGATTAILFVKPPAVHEDKAVAALVPEQEAGVEDRKALETMQNAQKESTWELSEIATAKQVPKLDPAKYGYYSEIIEENGEKVRQFHFPEDVTIGRISTYNFEFREAKGLVKFAEKETLVFVPYFVTGEYPAYAGHFRHGDIGCLQVHEKACNDKVLAAISTIPGVFDLKIYSNRQLTARSAASLSNFENLTTYDGSWSTLSGDILSRANCWDKIVDFWGGDCQRMHPMISLLSTKRNVKRVSFAGSEITGADCQLLGRYPELIHCDVNRNKLTLADVRALNKTGKIETLKIKQCGLLGEGDKDLSRDKAVQKVVQGFKHLKKLEIFSHKPKAERLIDWQRALPGIKID